MWQYTCGAQKSDCLFLFLNTANGIMSTSDGNIPSHRLGTNRIGIMNHIATSLFHQSQLFSTRTKSGRTQRVLRTTATAAETKWRVNADHAILFRQNSRSSNPKIGPRSCRSTETTERRKTNRPCRRRRRRVDPSRHPSGRPWLEAHHDVDVPVRSPLAE